MEELCASLLGMHVILKDNLWYRAGYKIMELVFIRHGKTKGNMQSRYIGTTDEGLCKEGINELRNNKVI